MFRLYKYLEQSIIVELVSSTNHQMQRRCLMLLEQISPQGRHTTPVGLMHAEGETTAGVERPVPWLIPAW